MKLTPLVALVLGCSSVQPIPKSETAIKSEAISSMKLNLYKYGYDKDSLFYNQADKSRNILLGLNMDLDVVDFVFNLSLPKYERIKAFEDQLKRGIEGEKKELVESSIRNKLGSDYMILGNYDRALEILQPLKENHLANGLTGKCYEVMGDVEKAITYYQKAANLSEKIEDKIQYIALKNNVLKRSLEEKE